MILFWGVRTEKEWEIEESGRQSFRENKTTEIKDRTVGGESALSEKTSYTSNSATANTYFICLWRGCKEIFRIKNSIFYVYACTIENFTSPADSGNIVVEEP